MSRRFVFAKGRTRCPIAAGSQPGESAQDAEGGCTGACLLGRGEDRDVHAAVELHEPNRLCFLIRSDDVDAGENVSQARWSAPSVGRLNQFQKVADVSRVLSPYLELSVGWEQTPQDLEVQPTGDRRKDAVDVLRRRAAACVARLRRTGHLGEVAARAVLSVQPPVRTLNDCSASPGPSPRLQALGLPGGLSSACR